MEQYEEQAQEDLARALAILRDMDPPSDCDYAHCIDRAVGVVHLAQYGTWTYCMEHAIMMHDTLRDGNIRHHIVSLT